MARPKTEASTYIPVTFRIPPSLLKEVKSLMEESGAPLNTELKKLVQLGVETKKKTVPSRVERQRRTAAGTPS